MVKSILKEICIMILLCMAIVLVLGVLFYDYFPKNSAKIIPNKVAYTAPEEIVEELQSSVSENTQQVIKTYTVEESDLNVYEKINYDKGKRNPMAPSNESENVGNTNSSSTGNNTNSTNTNSTGTFFENTGTK